MKPDTDFSIRSILGGYDQNFTYIITCMRTGMQVCVDAAVDRSSIEPYIRSEPAALLVTHTHGDHIARFDQRSLIDTGVLVRTRVLTQIVNVHARFSSSGFIVIDSDNNARSIHRINFPTTSGNDGHARIDSYSPFHACTNEWSLATQRRNCLPLHIRAH